MDLKIKNTQAFKKVLKELIMYINLLNNCLC